MNTQTTIGAILAGAVFAFSHSAKAETELQSFYANIPPQAQLAFAKYRSCESLIVLGNKDPLQELEASITRACEKDLLKEAHHYLSEIRFTASQRRSMIERYLTLAKTERRLSYEGKPIPGYQLDPETAKIMDCEKKMSATIAAYKSCIDDALITLIRYSADPSDVVADSAIGTCVSKRYDLISAFACFGGDRDKANASASRIDRTLRSSALGKVAATRAELRRRQMELGE